MPDNDESAIGWLTNGLEKAKEFEFSAEGIGLAPSKPGVYQILQEATYARYQGVTRVLKIRQSDSDLRSELLNHLDRHTAANRLSRIRRRPSAKVSFKCLVTVEGAREAESSLLRTFEDEHWDLPVLNSQRGYGRGEDRKYRE